MARIDFAGLRAALISRSRELLPAWLPNGKFRGREYVVGDLSGNPGDSLSINCETGAWADFAAPDARGGDLIDLYAALHGLSNADAARALAGDYAPQAPAAARPPREHAEPRLIKPNGHVAGFSAQHPRHGLPSAIYWYRETDGTPLWCVARYETPDGKQFSPWTFDGTRWRAKAAPKPRTLFGLELTAKFLDPVSIIVTEGEKCALALNTLLLQIEHPRAVAISWAGGANAWQTASWDALAHRRVILWPDADEPGWRCMAELAAHLMALQARVEILDTHGQPSGWDAADFTAAGATRASLAAFIRDHARDPSTLAAAVSPSRDITPVSVSRETLSEDSDSLSEPSFGNYAAAWRHYGLETGAQGAPWPNTDNVCRVLRAHRKLSKLLWYDTFSRRKMLGDEPWEDDLHSRRLLIDLQGRVGIAKLAYTTICDAVRTVSRERSRHAIASWLDTLTHDGTARLATWLTVALGCPDDAYHRAVGQNWLIAMVARAYQPGCRCQAMVVLEGPQGAGKTQALRIIGGRWYGTTPAAIGEKDFLDAIGRSWLLELEELDNLKASAQERIKATISRPVDQYRRVFTGEDADRPRTCFLAGTTNQAQWIADETGARRFWPLSVTQCNQAWLSDNRDQLFAEAVTLYRTGQSWWEIPSEQLAISHELRFITDPWHESIEMFIAPRTEVRTYEIYDHLAIDALHRSRNTDMRIGAVLRKLGWRRHVTKVAERSVRVWRNDVSD